jgi:hypothetical protein
MCRTVALAAAVAVTALVSACGGYAGSEPSSAGTFAHTPVEDSASQSAQALSEDLAMVRQAGPAGARGAAAACDLMTRQAQEQLLASARIAAGPRSEAESCADALLYLAARSRSRGLPASAGGRVADVRVRGSLAEVAVEASDGRRSTMTLAMENGGWKLAASE